MRATVIKAPQVGASKKFRRSIRENLKPAPAWTCYACGTPEKIINGGLVCPKCMEDMLQ